MPEISGYFPSNFWSKLVLPATQADPAVLHAVIALSSVHELKEHPIPGQTDESSKLKFALIQSMKAMKHCQQLSRDAPRSAEVVLTSCILFFFLESFQKNHHAALFHLNWGMKIIGSFLNEENGKAQSDSREKISPPDDGILKETLIPIFARLDISASLYDDTRPVQFDRLYRPLHQLPSIFSIPDAFSSLQEADESLITLVYLLMSQQQKVDTLLSGTIDAAPTDLVWSTINEATEQNNIFLTRWLEALNAMLRQRKGNMDAKDLRAVLVLKGRHLTICIANCAKTSEQETNYDVHMADFERVLTMSASLLKYKSYSVDLNILVPLLYAVTKCRDPKMRRKALALLSQAPRQEGIWDSELFAVIGRWVIEKEENERVVMSAEDVPAEARITIVKKAYNFGEKKCLVTYCQKSQTVGGHMDVREEVLTW